MQVLKALPAALVVASAGAQVHVESLGTVPGRESQVFYTSDDGSTAVGVFVLSDQSQVPFRWTDTGGFEDLTTLGAAYVEVAGMSASGDEVIGTLAPSRAVRWDSAGVIQDLGDLGAPNFAAARGISADGSTVVGKAFVAGGGTRAFRWTEATGMQDLGTIGGDDSEALAASDDGAVVVGSARHPDGAFRGVYWTAVSGLVTITSTSMGAAVASDVSADGSVVVGRGSPSGAPAQVFRYTAATGAVPIGFGVFPAGTVQYPKVSADGSTVVWSEFDGVSSSIGFRWTAATGAVPFPLDMAPTDLSHDGTVVSGAGVVGGAFVGYRWTEAQGSVALDSMGGATSYGAGITADGDSILGIAARFDGTFHAARWNADEHVGRSFCGPAITNSSGAPAQLTATGTNEIALNACTLAASSMPTGSFGYFLGSQADDSVFPVANSAGRLCLGGSIGRFIGPGEIQNSGTAGQFELQLDLGALATPVGLVGAAPGETWYFQAWFRDSSPSGLTSNFSSGVMVTLW